MMDIKGKDKPIIVALKGHPGTGKSTLAEAVAKALKWPLIDKDHFRDSTHTIEQALRQVSPTIAAKLLNGLSYEAMWKVISTQLSLGLSVVVDSPLSRCHTRLCGKIHHLGTTKSELLSSFPEEAKSSSKQMKIKANMQKSSKRFLFTEAGKDFVDFLLSFLTIPSGEVVRLLGANSSLGCIDNLNRSIVSFDGGNFLKTHDTKDWLFKPKLPPHYLSRHQIFSVAVKASPELHRSGTSNEGYLCICYCGSCAHKVCFVDPKGQGSALFMVTDDLTATPLRMLSGLSLIQKLEIPLSDIQELEIDIGHEEALSILRTSLHPLLLL